MTIVTVERRGRERREDEGEAKSERRWKRTERTIRTDSRLAAKRRN